MTSAARVLPERPHRDLGDYVAAGGGAGLFAALGSSPGRVIDVLEASGLRGRGGAGFPTATKWRTVRSFASPLLHTSVVVNGAEGEPGTFKDRAILRANPYAVVEGALIAAHAVEARSVVVAVKSTFVEEIGRLRAVFAEMQATGWCDDVEFGIVEGPSAYLFGEETALLEVVDGRPPFPRIAPPYRRGVVEVVTSRAEADFPSGQAATVQMAQLDGQSIAPPVLINNVETLANVPGILARGAAWFRSIGTAASPGSVVCTVTGAVRTPCVIEVEMGTTLEEVLAAAGGVLPGTSLQMVLVGVSGAVITPDRLDTALTYEDMAALGYGLGSAGFTVIGDDVSAVGVAAGVSRFLAVESCGQCTPCKQDGAQIASLLERLRDGRGDEADLSTVEQRIETVADGARCGLAAQQQVVVGSLVRHFRPAFEAQAAPGAAASGDYLVAPLSDLIESGALVDVGVAAKQLDWSTDAVDSGRTPVDRLAPRHSN